MKVTVLKETYPGERRVALVPANLKQLIKAGCEIQVEAGAGDQAGFSDEEYQDKGAQIVNDHAQAMSGDVLLQVRGFGANQEAGASDLEHFRDGQAIIGMCDPLGEPEAVRKVAETGVRFFSLEMIPRITRAQSMDVLSSQATIAGYRAVLLGATELPKMFPMLMTAAGTLSPARVFIVGVGVAGLQAIATAKRLGGVVHAYDVRPACREQVESLGGKFVELELEAGQAEDKGGYAKAMGDEFYKKQRELMASVVAESDVVITTAAIPGKPSPMLITAEAVAGMSQGSVIIDLATERGGNCEPSNPDERVVDHGVVILGPTNLPSEIPNHASQMFSNNVTKFLLNMVKDGELNLDLQDEIIADTLVTQDGEVFNPRVRDLLELPPLETDSSVAEDQGQDEPAAEESSSGEPAEDTSRDELAPIPFDSEDETEDDDNESKSDSGDNS